MPSWEGNGHGIEAVNVKLGPQKVTRSVRITPNEVEVASLIRPPPSSADMSKKKKKKKCRASKVNNGDQLCKFKHI
jgi:hypothetical protein